MNTRYDEKNANAECSFCNRFKSDHLDGYRENLIRKIGQEEFDKLRVRANMSRRWSEWELEMMIKHYQAKVKELKKTKPF